MSDEEPGNRLMMIKTVEKLTARIEELERWQEFVRFNSKEAAYMADDALKENTHD